MSDVRWTHTGAYRRLACQPGRLFVCLFTCPPPCPIHSGAIPTRRQELSLLLLLLAGRLPFLGSRNQSDAHHSLAR